MDFDLCKAIWNISFIKTIGQKWFAAHVFTTMLIIYPSAMQGTRCAMTVASLADSKSESEALVSMGMMGMWGNAIFCLSVSIGTNFYFL